MKYPNIKIKIAEQIPSISLQNKEGENKELLRSEKAIDTVLLEVMDAVGIQESFDDTLSKVREADEQYLMFPVIEKTDTKLDFDKVIKTVEAESDTHQPPHGVDQKIIDQLELNWQMDVVSSALEEIYNIVIARVYGLAMDTGIDTVVLEDDRNEPRLKEKMSKELGFAGIDCYVI